VVAYFDILKHTIHWRTFLMIRIWSILLYYFEIRNYVNLKNKEHKLFCLTQGSAKLDWIVLELLDRIFPSSDTIRSNTVKILPPFDTIRSNTVKILPPFDTIRSNTVFFSPLLDPIQYDFFVMPIPGLTLRGWQLNGLDQKLSDRQTSPKSRIRSDLFCRHKTIRQS
jgi:hypothetical protein